MSQKYREQPVVRAYANQDAIDLVSDDDWDEYEARLLQGSSSGTAPTSAERNSQSPSKSSAQKRKRDEEVTSLLTGSGERATKRPRSSDDSKSGKPLETITAVGSRTNPTDTDVPVLIVDVNVDDSAHSTNSVVHQAPVENSSRLSGGNKMPSKLGASVDVTGASDTSPLLSAQTRRPEHPGVEKETDDAGRNVSTAKPKGNFTKLVKPEKKKSKKQLEAEKKALDLREKKMTRREFIQYLYEEKLREELENAPPKRLVLKDKVIWYAEPGSAKASDSFDRRRYEMVRSSCRCLALSLILLPAYSPRSHRRARLRRHNGYPCHIPKLHEG